MAKKTKVFDEIEVVDIGHKGHCIGRTPDGMAVIVEDSLPGRVISGTSRRKKKGMHLVRPTETLKASPYEVEPRCEHFESCGGCKWQHMDYEAQINFKEKQVHNAITRLGGIDTYEKLPIVPSPDIYAFRNKMEFSFSNQRWLTEDEVQTEGELDRLGLGLHPPGRFDRVVDIDACHLMSSEVDDIRNFVRDHARTLGLTFYDVRGQRGDMRSLVIRSNRQGQFMVNVVFGTRDLTVHHARLMEDIEAKFSHISSLYFMCNTKANDSLYDIEARLHSGEPYLEETLGERRFRIGPKSFFQTNPNQTEQLYKAVADAADLQPGHVAYDLYSGLGSIAIYVAQPGIKIVAVEEVAPAVEDAQVNAALNNCEDIQFYTGRMEHLVDEMDDNHWPSPDIIITDPPRAGMHERVVDFILKKAPARIVYVSCNPATQARDLKLLSEKYAVKTVQPFDMFPHTSHVESLAVLERLPST